MTELINHKVWLTRPKILGGIMTGTSLDSVDIAFAEFSSGMEGQHKMKFLGNAEYALPKGFKDHVLDLINNSNHISKYSRFEYIFAKVLAEKVNKAIKKLTLDRDKIDAIGVHGQTIWHQPNPEKLFGKESGYSMQLLSGSALANELNIPVVYDFRAADIACGGNVRLPFLEI